MLAKEALRAASGTSAGGLLSPALSAEVCQKIRPFSTHFIKQSQLLWENIPMLICYKQVLHLSVIVS